MKNRKVKLITLGLVIGLGFSSELKAISEEEQAVAEDQRTVEEFLATEGTEDQGDLEGSWIRPRPGYSGYPGYRRHFCVAVDRGWEEHRNGHPGYGRTQREAAYASLAGCRRFHGACAISRCGIY